MLRFRACDGHAGTVDSCNYCATEAALTGRQTNEAMPLTAKQMTAAIKSGRDQKLPDGHGLYLVVKNGFGFWVYQYWDHGCAFRRSRPPIPTDRDHLFRLIATSVARGAEGTVG